MGPLTVYLYDRHLQDAFVQSSFEWICDPMLDSCSCSMLTNSRYWIYSDEGCVTPWQLGLENCMITWRCQKSKPVQFKYNNKCAETPYDTIPPVIEQTWTFQKLSPVWLHGEEADAEEEEEDDDDEEWQPEGRASPATGKTPSRESLSSWLKLILAHCCCRTGNMLDTARWLHITLLLFQWRHFYCDELETRDCVRVLKVETYTFRNYNQRSNFLAHYRHMLNLYTGKGKKV